MTEAADPRYGAIDRWPAAAGLAAIWEGQLAAVAAVGPALPALATAVEAAAGRLQGGEGRIVYAGAGSSIRAAVQDGAELGPTFDWPSARLAYLIAGGEAALLHAAEGAEDDAADARAQIAAAGIGPADVVLALAASGRTPFTLAATGAARDAGALTVGIACAAGSPLLAAAEHPVLVSTGAEPVAGSTRMKAGLAQKAVLALFSTQLMIALGRVHDGLMVDMRPLNAKLRNRARAVVARIAGVENAVAAAALEAAGGRIKPAVLVALGMAPDAAVAALQAAGGRLRMATAALPAEASRRGPG